MSEPNVNVPQEKQSFFGVIVHSFFVVPFLLAVFSVLFFVGVRILTMEKKSVYDYIDDVREGGLTKRWQSAFELSRMLSNKASIPQDEKFITEMINAYQKSVSDDARVRQYLILAMAKSGRVEFVDELLKNIAQEKDENLYATITSLGILKSNKAVGALLPYLEDSNSRVRLATVVALGNIGDEKAIEPLKQMLNDPEPNITWDAAVALAKIGDTSGRSLLLKLLDKNYLNEFSEVDSLEQSKIMQVVIQTTASWQDPEFDLKLEELFASDKNMNVRAIAKKVLESKKLN